MLEKLTIVFPLCAALGVTLWFCRWFSLRRRMAVPPEPEKTDGRRFTKADWIWLLILCVVYGIVAYIGLGSDTAPQSFLYYEAGNYYAQTELNVPTEITGVRYYCGLNTGSYTLQFSADGENWIDQVDADGNPGMTQEYTELFRWNDADLSADNGPVKYVRIISSTEMWLGEVVLYDADGQVISTDDMTINPGCETLFDEQDTVPDSYSYLNGTYFDEIYHPRTAYEHIEGVWPYEITHPPLGKLIIGLGIRLFGMTPLGWRFMGVLFGILMLPVLYVLLKRMFGSTAVALCGSVVFAFDFMHYTQTRLATIDTYAVFFILLMYLFMYLWLTEPPENGKKRLLWLGLCGLSFGLGAASKWTCFYAGAGLGVAWLGYWIWRFVKDKENTLLPFLENVLWCMLFFIAVPCVIYYASYYPYGTAAGLSGVGMYFTKDYLQIVLDNQSYMWNYHSSLVATHPYSSKWYQWLLDIRPILYYLDYYGDGTKSAIACFNNPLLSWGGLCAMVAMAYIGWKERDKKALFILLGYAANLLPWVLVSRLTFAYHYFPCTIFLVLAICYVFNDLRRRDVYWRRAVYSYTVACVLLFVMFYPVLSGVRCSEAYTTYFLKWLPGIWPL